MGLTLALLPLTACTDDSPTDPSLEALAAVVDAGQVNDLTVTSVTNTTVTLKWTQVDDGTGSPAWYRVKYATPPIDWSNASMGCNPTIKGDQIGAEISCTVEGLTPGDTYDFQLMSYRTQGGRWKGAVYSNVATAQTTTPGAGTAAEVGDLTVTAATESSLTLRWTQVEDGTGQPASYQVRYATPPFSWGSATVGCDPTLTGTQVGTELSCTIQGLDAGTTYAAQVMAFRMEGGAPQGAAYSNLATGQTTIPVPGDATSVGDLAITATSQASLTLTWTQVDDGTGQPADYRVKYAVPPMTNWGNLPDSGCDVDGTEIGQVASCTIEGLEAGTTYDVQLMSYRLVGGAWQGAVYSNIATGTTDAAATTPIGNADAVTDLAVTDITDTSLSVRWTQVDDGTGQPADYQVRYGTAPISWSGATVACDPTLAGTQIGAELTCTIQGLIAETTYDVQLVAFRSAGGAQEGAAYSNVARARTTTPPTSGNAAVVEDLTVTGASETSLTVRWTQVDDGTGAPADYRVKYASPSMTDWANADTGCDVNGTQIGQAVSCTIQGLGAGTPYEVQLMSYRMAGGAWQGAVYSNIATGTTDGSSVTPLPDADAVTDLAVTSSSESSLTVHWTQVADGTGQPASYQVRYDTPPLSWNSASVACGSTMSGSQIGTGMTCTIRGLDSGATYDVQLMSYRMVGGSPQGAVYSNVTTGETSTLTTPPPSSGSGIWISPQEIAALPTSGSAWSNLLSEANGSCGSLDLSNQDQNNNVCIMAKALVYARTGQSGYRSDVEQALRQIVNSGTYNGRALALGRELAAYVISADLIDLQHADPSLDGQFRNKIRELLTTYTNSGPSSLVQCHEQRPNNWGTHCGASRAAVAAYLGDDAELARVAQVFRGWLGERSVYAGFKYGDLAWQCDSSRPVGINPVGCTRNGHSIDGVLPDDERRAGGFAWPPPKENYVWEALQGALAQAIILERAGYPVFEWGDRALLRAAQWLHNQADFPAEGDDEWQPWVLNHFYGTNFPAPSGARPGKNVGWTDWTLGR